MVGNAQLIIRQEKEQDCDAVYKVVKEAFASAECADGDEQDLVNRLRESAEFIPELSLVAELEGEIVGYILFTRLMIAQKPELALAPVSVKPGFQSMGIGGGLIVRGHEIAAGLGYKAVVVVGHADYYPRFGYEPACKYGIKAPFAVPDENFMVKFLSADGAEGLSGMVTYSPAFFEIE